MVSIVTPTEELLPPPQSIESEQSVLGGLLLTNGQAYDRIDFLKPEHFHSSLHREIYEHTVRLVERGKPADAITVRESMGGSAEDGAYLASLATNTPSSANIKHYAEAVRAKWMLRQIQTIAADTVARAQNHNADPKAIAATAEAAFLAVLDDTRGGEDISFADAVKRAVDAREAPETSVLPTGLHNLDRILKGGGMKPGQLIVIAGRPSMGKAQPLDSKILLENGRWSTMGDMQPGTALASIDGKPSVVTGIFPQGDKAVYRVTFSDGRSAECCDEHLWLVNHRKWQKPLVKSTSEIRELLTNPSMAGRMWIDRISGDYGHNNQLPVDPWLLGALLGDGGMTGKTVTFTKTEAQILEMVRSTLPETMAMSHGGACTWRLSVPGYVRGKPGSNPLTAALVGLGLMGSDSYNKFVPLIYMTANREARLGVLRGLLDTDGWVEKTGSVQFSSASLQLAMDAQALARSLGYWCKMRSKLPHYTHKGERLQGATAYLITISGESTEELFLFDGKRDRCAATKRTQRVGFQTIEQVSVEPCQCISVSHLSHLYVTDDYVVTHNTALAFNIAEHVAVTKPVLGFSLEMENADVAERSLAYHAGLTNQDQAALYLMDLKLRLDDSPAVTLGHIRLRARRMKRKHGLALIVVDYLQLMTGRGDNREQEISGMSRGLKAIAKELQVPVLLLSQLNRGVEQRQDKRPMLSDLRESGAIEQDADTVIMLYRDEYYNPETSQAKGLAEAIFRKQRGGRVGTAWLSFDPETTRFHDYLGPAPVAPARQQKVSNFNDYKSKAAGE